MIRERVEKVIEICSGKFTTFEAFVEVALDELCKTSEVEGTECMSDVASLKALRISVNFCFKSSGERVSVLLITIKWGFLSIKES